MSDQWDLAAYDRDDQLVLAVEVKNKLNASPEWASRLRRNIFAHGVYPNPPYFLMAFPDQFFLWSHEKTGPEDVAPMYAIDPQPILDPFLKTQQLPVDQISGLRLEFMIVFWLGELMRGKNPDDLEKAQRWLVDFGLYEALAGGRLNSGSRA